MKKSHKILSLLFIFVLTLNTTSTAKAFSDVPEDSWYAGAVKNLVSAGIVDEAEKFRPGDKLKRAELMKMVMIAIGEVGKEPLPGHPTFDDVPLGVWFSPYVERAATLGIISGYADAEGNLSGWFGPADPVTRAAAVKILVEGFDLKTSLPPSVFFGDVTGSDWFYNYVQTASTLGIVEGYEGGIFKPNQAVTRSEMAKILSLAIIISQNPPPAPVEGEVPPVKTPGELPQLPNVPPASETPFKANLEAINPDLVVADGGQKYVGHYTFEGQLEGFTVDTLTVVNDVVGDNLGDDLKNSLALKTITLKFPDKNGNLKTATKPLGADGKARFSGLEFFVKRNVETPLEIYADLSPFSDIGAKASGETFRLGVQNVSNTLTSFKAIGEFSNSTVTLGDPGFAANISDTELFTVRKTVPSFELVKPAGTLVGGSNNLISLKVTADKNGSLGLGRLVFELSVSDEDNANLSLNDFRFFEGSDLIESATIFDATGTQDLSLNGGGSLKDGQSKVIVSFNEEETVSAGQTKTYSLKANITGSANNDSISSTLANGDEILPLLGLTAENQENTGKLFVSGDATAGLFTAAATDFSQLIVSNLNILWSDLSFQPHATPQVTNGSVLSGSGSTDWTNGSYLAISSLESSILSK